VVVCAIEGAWRCIHNAPAGWADRRVHAHLHRETAGKEEEERDIKDLHLGAQMI